MKLLIFFQVRVLYDFDAQPGSGELSVKEGEILTVSRQDVGEGWWEGTNSAGQAGLFPAAYVEVSNLQSFSYYLFMYLLYLRKCCIGTAHILQVV